MLIYFLNFLLNPQRPTKPDARRSMVEGSGTDVVAEEIVRVKLVSKLVWVIAMSRSWNTPGAKVGAVVDPVNTWGPLWSI